MNCPHCGNDLPNNALFCPLCGTRIDLTATQPEMPIVETPYVPGTGPRAQQYAPTAPASHEHYEYQYYEEWSEPTQPTSSRRRMPAALLGVIIALVVMLAALVIGAVSCSVVSAAAHGTSPLIAPSHTSHPVTFYINIADGYDTDSSRIPVRITGTDVDGNDVDETIFLAYSGVDVELSEGDYHAEVLGSPITSDGTIFEIPEEGVDFTIDSDLDPYEEYKVDSGWEFVFVPIDPEDMTDEQIKDALAWARKDEESGADVGKLEEAVYARRDSAAAEGSE